MRRLPRQRSGSHEVDPEEVLYNESPDRVGRVSAPICREAPVTGLGCQRQRIAADTASVDDLLAETHLAGFGPRGSRCVFAENGCVFADKQCIDGAFQISGSDWGQAIDYCCGDSFCYRPDEFCGENLVMVGKTA